MTIQKQKSLLAICRGLNNAVPGIWAVSSSLVPTGAGGTGASWRPCNPQVRGKAPTAQAPLVPAEKRLHFSRLIRGPGLGASVP